ncbi:MAG: MBL fold metallo-hydrolase [Candidatus Thiodiazotropha endolucinida]
MTKVNRVVTIFLVILVSIVSVPATTDEQQPGKISFEFTQITEKIYVIYGPFDLPNEHNGGFRNNPVIVLTSDGVVVFDPGGSAWAGEMIVESLKSITSEPVIAIFNSHAHGDHWLGNEGVKRSYPNAVIYCHPLMKSKLKGEEGLFWLNQIEQLTKNTAGGREVIVPGRTLSDGDLIRVGDTQFLIYHPGPAHTDNDIMIEIVGEEALFMGDVVRNGLLGIMESDASFSGNIAAIDHILSKDLKYYIPGHGLVGDRDMVLSYRGYLDALLKTVRKLYADDLADYEMKPFVTDAVSRYKDWAGFNIRVGAHISRAYLEVEKEDF